MILKQWRGIWVVTFNSKLILPIRLWNKNHWQIISDTIKSSDVSNKYGILKTLDIIGLQAQLEGNYATSIYVTQKLNDNVHNKVDKIQAVIHKAMKEKTSHPHAIQQL